MSFEAGWAAIHLEKPERIPRTEYSADEHWDLVNKVTNMNVNLYSPKEEKQNAKRSFQQTWNYDLVWSVLVDSKAFGKHRSSMGHASYQDGGDDFDNQIFRLYDSPEQVLVFDPFEVLGEVNVNEMTNQFNKHYKANVNHNSDCVQMTGIYITLMSGLIDLFGWDLLLHAAANAEKFGELANRYTKWIYPYFAALGNSESPVVMVHDDIVWSTGPFIHPDWYRANIFPNYKRLFEPLLQNGKKILYTCDGNYTMFVDDIASCGVHGFVLEPLTDLNVLIEKYGQSHVLIGNVDTTILLNGSKDEIYNEVMRCVNIGKDCPGYFMAVGNHIPSNTPVENALYYNEVYQENSNR